MTRNQSVLSPCDNTLFVPSNSKFQTEFVKSAVILNQQWTDNEYSHNYKSHDNTRFTFPSIEEFPAMSSKELIAVAIDKDKHSQNAVKWTVDNLLLADKYLILIHVRVRNHQAPATTTHNKAAPKFEAKFRSEVKQLYLPYRGFCARKGVQIKEVVLDDVEVSEAILSYIYNQSITKIVVGAPTRGFFQSWSKKTIDVPTSLNKNAPDFCSVYVVAKGRTLSVKEATRSPPLNLSLPSVPTSPREKPRQNASEFCQDSISTPKTRYSTDSSSFFSSSQSSGMTSQDSSISSARSSSASQIEAEMRRLRLQARQIASEEADSAKQKGLEFQHWKMNEAGKFEQVKPAEETAKAKSEASIESAETSKKLAELEAMRKKIEMEGEQKSKGSNSLLNSNIRYRMYDIEDIRASTSEFSDSLKIGEGGYGPVYRAYLKHTLVAVKVLRSDAAQGMKQFNQEVEVLSCIRHPNMVLLLGACPEYGCLVYEYMDNGSLEDRLFRKGNTPSIPWKTRFKIAAEIATGLLFLHQAEPEPIVHRDLKPGNILLDSNYSSKISDVGLARLVPPSVADSVTQYHMTSAAGTFCYIDPEYQQTGMLGTKSDIYSLGVLLLQIITARPPIGLTFQVEKSIERGNFSAMLDPTVPDWPVEEALAFAKLALKCVELRRKDRPDLEKEILPELDRIRGIGNRESAASYSHLRSPNEIQERTKSDPTNAMPYFNESGFGAETASASSI